MWGFREPAAMSFVGKDSKKSIVRSFGSHVSSGKVDFYMAVDLDFVMGKRRGSWMYDVSGKNKLLNCHCNGGVFNLGHRNPVLIRVMIDALKELDIGNHHLISEQRARLGKKLARVNPPGLSRVVFGVSGGEAVDFAIKLARAQTGRQKIVYASGGYHGHTGLALAAGADHFKRPFEPLAPGFVEVPFGDTEAVSKVIDEQTAAVLFETIPATLGMPIPSDGFYRAVREVCDRKGLLLILDEIQTGLGRTGKLWAFQHYGITPDIFTIGKGLSGGLYPMSATCYREELDSFMHENPFIHVSTFGGAELGCPVAERVLDISSSKEFLSRVNISAAKVANGLDELREQYSDILTEVRQLGLFIGLKMNDMGYGPLMSIACYNNGLFAVYADNDKSVLQFLPPLTITDAEISYMLRSLNRAYSWAGNNPKYLELARALVA